LLHFSRQEGAGDGRNRRNRGEKLLAAYWIGGYRVTDTAEYLCHAVPMIERTAAAI
jgi:hypothetical protein